MKAEVEVADRIRWLLSRELQRRVDEARTRLPHLCRHNRQQVLDPREVVDGDPNPLYNRITAAPHLPVVQTIGLCMYGAESPTTWPGDICEDPIDAQRCGIFESLQTKDQIFEVFQQEVDDPEWLERNLPEVHELVWVLDGLTGSVVPWWIRIWWWFLRIRPEPIRTVPSLLPESIDGLRTS
jgi:hypothetical protein